MAETKNYKLFLTDSDDINFFEWREKINGQSNSNMTKIDEAMALIAAGKIDGLSYENNVLKLMSGGVPIGDGIEIISYQEDNTVIDTEVSDTSENAVQNKVIKAYIDSLLGNIDAAITEINAILGGNI